LRQVWLVLGIGLIVFSPLLGLAEDFTMADYLQTMSSRLVAVARRAGERATAAGQGEAAQVEEFLFLSQARLETAKEAVGNISATVNQVMEAVARIHTFVVAITQGEESDPTLKALMPLAETVERLAGEAMAKAEAAAQTASQAAGEMEALMKSVMLLEESAVYPPPLGKARVEASDAKEALTEAEEGAAQVAQALEAQDIIGAVKALHEVLVAGSKCWEASWTAENILSGFRSTVLSWERTIYGYEREILSAYGEVTAALQNLQAVLAILEDLTSAGVIPMSP